MDYGERAIGIPMDADLHPHIVAAIPIGRDLKDQAIKSDTIIIAYRTLILFTEDIFEW
jgi:hypothetical protein